MNYLGQVVFKFAVRRLVSIGDYKDEMQPYNNVSSQLSEVPDNFAKINERGKKSQGCFSVQVSLQSETIINHDLHAFYIKIHIFSGCY